MIGDPDQAIYGFRGADVQFFLRFAADFPAASTARLSTCYRSSPAIVAGAAAAIAPGTLVPGRVLRPAPAAAGAAAAGSKITFHEAADPAGEAAWIAEAIDRLLGGTSLHSLDSGRADGHGHEGLGLADIAVLYRTDAQAAALGQGLTRAGLPFQKRSHDYLERRPGVAEIVRELKLASGGPARGGPGAAAAALGSGRGGARRGGPRAERAAPAARRGAPAGRPGGRWLGRGWRAVRHRPARGRRGAGPAGRPVRR